MPGMWRNKILCVVVLVGVLAVGAAPIWAAEGYTAPTLESKPPWRAIGAMALCLAWLLVAGLKNSRRAERNVNR